MPDQRYVVRVADRAYDVAVGRSASSDLAPVGDARVRIPGDEAGATLVRVGERAFTVREVPGGALLVREAGGTRQRRVVVDDPAHPRAVALPGAVVDLELVTAQQAAFEAAMAGAGGGRGEGRVEAPMPGQVIKVLVAEGDSVEVDDPVVIVEAMKMENELRAPTAGTVAAVAVRPGQAVDAGQLLCEIVAHPE